MANSQDYCSLHCAKVKMQRRLELGKMLTLLRHARRVKQSEAALRVMAGRMSIQKQCVELPNFFKALVRCQKISLLWQG